MTTATKLEIIKKAGRIGAEIRGVQLTADIDAETLAGIQQAIEEHQVVFFKGQNHLDDASHEAFATKLGELYAHPTVPVKENSQSIFELDSEKGAKANIWHTDVTFVPDVPKYSVLRGVKIPSVGGDTVWANTHAAYEDLPKELQKLADNLWAVHSNKFDYATSASSEGKEYRDVFAATVYETRHPVVHVHKETGKKHLLLGGFVRQFEGYSTSQSEALLNIFQSYVTRLENTVRWNWDEGDVLIWDNLATQHYAIADYDEQRIVRRITVGKNVPVSVNGQESQLVSKN